MRWRQRRWQPIVSPNPNVQMKTILELNIVQYLEQQIEQLKGQLRFAQSLCDRCKGGKFNPPSPIDHAAVYKPSESVALPMTIDDAAGYKAAESLARPTPEAPPSKPPRRAITRRRAALIQSRKGKIVNPEVIAAVADLAEPFTAETIAHALGWPRKNAALWLWRAERRGWVHKVKRNGRCEYTRTRQFGKAPPGKNELRLAAINQRADEPPAPQAAGEPI